MTNNDNLFDDVDFGDMDLEGTAATPEVKAEVVAVVTPVTEVVNTDFTGIEEGTITEAIDTLMTADPLDVDNFFGELGVKEEKKEAKGKGKKAATTEKKDEEPKEPEFSGPRPVIVYGQELFIEEDPSVTLETIRARIVNEFKFPEFSKERTFMSFDKNTGIIVPAIEFKKKG